MVAAPVRAGKLAADEVGVTAVIGSVLVLGITVVGIAAVLLWGAPTIERIQSRNALDSMVGQMEQVRDAAASLSVADQARFVRLSIPSGELGIRPGSRIMVTTAHDAGFPSCSFHVADWADEASPASVTISFSSCRSGIQLHIERVNADALVAVFSGAATNGAVTAAGADFTTGDWAFRLTDSSTPPLPYAQAWLHGADDLQWTLSTRSGLRNVALDAGALFTQADDATYLAGQPAIADLAVGSQSYAVWLRTPIADAGGGATGPSRVDVHLALVGNFARTDVRDADVRLVRFDIDGPWAESWCNALLGRNNHLEGASYGPLVTDCGGDAEGVRSVLYARDDGAGFPFRLLHARIHVALSI